MNDLPKSDFHHYVAVPEDQRLDGIDDKAFAQQLHWVRELGERISQQPDFESAAIDRSIAPKQTSMTAV